MTAPLHIIQSAAALERCLRRATTGSTMLLVEDAVYAALTPRPDPTRALYVLAEDLTPRALTPGDLTPGITAIDMKGFVALTVAHSPIVTWF